MTGGDRRLLGRWGETQVADWLRARDWRVVAAGWRCRFGEIDLIAVNNKYIVFTEVKLRKNATFAPARAFVDRGKQERVRTAAQLYLQEHPTELQPRFDVAEVYCAENGAMRVEYLAGAFE